MVDSYAYLQSKEINISAAPSGLFFNPDGTCFYTLSCGTSPARIHRFTLSTPWNALTASEHSSASLSGTTQPRGLFFKPDGTKLFYLGQDTLKLYGYSLSSPWEIGALTLDGSQDIPYIEADLGLVIGASGTDFFVYGPYSGQRSFHHRVLSSAWAVASSSNLGIQAERITYDTVGQDICLSGDEEYIYSLNQDTLSVHVTEYSTPFDFATRTTIGYLTISASGITAGHGIYITPDNERLFTMSTQDGVYKLVQFSSIENPPPGFEFWTNFSGQSEILV